MRKVNVELKCTCGHEFDSIWIVGSMGDWQCPKCGRRVGMDRMKLKEEEIDG